MRLMWTFVKVAVVLAIAIPLGLLALGLVAGLVRLAFRVAILGLIGYGVYHLARRFFAASPPPKPVSPLPNPDPYYTAAMRELDAEMGR